MFSESASPSSTDLQFYSSPLDGVTQETVNAEDLHARLEVSTPLRIWLPRRISEYGFEINVDYITYTETVENPLRGRPGVDYYLSLDMAKELAMVENNEKGREVRCYFIAREKQAKALLEQVNSLLEQEKNRLAQSNLLLTGERDEAQQKFAKFYQLYSRDINAATRKANHNEDAYVETFDKWKATEARLHGYEKDEVYAKAPQGYIPAKQCVTFLARGVAPKDYHEMIAAANVKTRQVRFRNRIILAYHYEEAQVAYYDFLFHLEPLEDHPGWFWSPLLEREVAYEGDPRA
jgi:phage anti-repressor protein